MEVLSTMRIRGSSGRIVSGYGLDDRAIGVRSPAEAMYNGYRGSSPWRKARPGLDADHSPPSSAEVKNE